MTTTKLDLAGFLEEVDTTTELDTAIFILADGTMIDGCFDCGVRSIDHNEMKSYFETNWDTIHKELKVVRLIPESMVALVGVDQTLTVEQKSLLLDSEYQVEEY